MPAGSPHDEIEKLDAKIEDSRVLMQLTAPAAGGSATMPMSVATDPACHPAPSDACHDSCTLASSICDNATKICDLAAQLEGDTWAAGKCEGAKATCSSAHAKCCGCS